jgi:hypothetical protein
MDWSQSTDCDQISDPSSPEYNRDYFFEYALKPHEAWDDYKMQNPVFSEKLANGQSPKIRMCPSIPTPSPSHPPHLKIARCLMQTLLVLQQPRSLI